MAKTRMLKHDLRTSEKVASWPIPLRYFWVLLWGYVDDHGKGKDNPQLIKADCFPLDDDVTADQINVWLDRFMIDAVVARYSVDGTRYLKVINWSEHQKPPHPSPDKIPGPQHPQAVSRMMHESLLQGAEPVHATFTHGLGWVESGLGSGGGENAQPPAAPPVDNSTVPVPDLQPLPFCPEHPGGTAAPCIPCKLARLASEGWKPAYSNPSRKPIIHMDGLCDAHRQPEATCEMCIREARDTIQAQFGGTA